MAKEVLSAKEKEDDSSELTNLQDSPDTLPVGFEIFQSVGVEILWWLPEREEVRVGKFRVEQSTVIKAASVASSGEYLTGIILLPPLEKSLLLPCLTAEQW
jgi:hypothetical protein